MEAATESKTEGSNQKKTRVLSGIRFPVYDLADSMAVAKVIHDRGGGVATADQLAAFLGYKSTQNGAYLGRVGAAKLFGLVTGGAGQFTITPLAQKILMPVYPDQVQEGLTEAFLNPPLFRAVYDECKGKDLPPEFDMKNLLRNVFEVTPTRVTDAYRTLMDSADQAGFFATRGAKTHLIMPVVKSAQPEDRKEEETPKDQAALGGGGGNGRNEGTFRGASKSRQDLQNEYVSTLIAMLRAKAESGEVDTELMSRIEKLLALSE